MLSSVLYSTINNERGRGAQFSPACKMIFVPKIDIIRFSIKDTRITLTTKTITIYLHEFIDALELHAVHPRFEKKKNLESTRRIWWST